jgi:hypothetical protein
MKHRGSAKLWPIVFALVAAQCTGNGEFTGPSTEQGNPQIVAIVTNGMKKPIPGAVVTVYKVPANIDSSVPPSAAELMGLSQTDSMGICSFEKLAPGTYSLKAVDPDSANSIIKTNIVISLSKPVAPEFNDTLVLSAPGAFHGIVTRAVSVNNQNLKDAFIQIKINEIDRSTTTGSDGKYSFLTLPAGTYTVYYYTDGFYSAKRENVKVRAGKDTVIDSVILKPKVLPPPKSFTAVYDTAAGVVHFNWQKVNFDGLWHYNLQRECIVNSDLNKVFSPFDTLFSDTIGAFPVGTTFYYVVRSIDKALNPSVNAGPIEITVADKGKTGK